MVSVVHSKYVSVNDTLSEAVDNGHEVGTGT
jgi:hypothetical protein